jgi:hypothetical protein
MSNPAEATVLASPWPDAPRLAFADAVADREPDRARLIRDEIAVLRARRAGDAGRVPEQARLVPLRARVQIPLFAALADLSPPGPRTFGLGRGFVESVRAPAGWLLRRAPELFARAPVLDVHVTALDEPLEALLAAPWMARLRWLGLAQLGLGDADVGWVVSADLPRLCALDLSSNRIGPAGLDALAMGLPTLRYVALAGNPAPDPNYRTRFADDHEAGPVPTTDSAAFLTRHPRCAWIGRYSADDPPMPGALHPAGAGC